METMSPKLKRLANAILVHHLRFILPFSYQAFCAICCCCCCCYRHSCFKYSHHINLLRTTTTTKPYPLAQSSQKIQYEETDNCTTRYWNSALQNWAAALDSLHFRTTKCCTLPRENSLGNIPLISSI